MQDGKGRRGRAASYEKARRALAENVIAEHAAGIDWQTPVSGELNRDMWQAEDGVPRWRRWLIGRRVLRELDYFNRMRGGR